MCFDNGRVLSAVAECRTCLAVTDVLVHVHRGHFIFLLFCQADVLSRRHRAKRLGEMIGEELGHKLAVEISQRFMRVSLQFIAAFSSS